MWHVDVALNTAKALLPFQGTLRAFKRKLFPYRGNARNADLAFRQGLEQIAVLRRCGFSFDGRAVLDLGSGWFPIVPILVRIAGAHQVHLTDLERLLDRETLFASARFLHARIAEIDSALGVPARQLETMLTPPALAFDDLLRWFGLTYTVPFDSGSMPHVDLVMSRTVLEHIPPPTLAKLFADFRDRLRDGGMLSHIIDHTDHRQHRDKSLSRIDFLRYSDTAWRLLTINMQDYTNRLRHTDYLTLLADAGYEILFEDRDIHPPSVEDARRMPLATRFKDIPPEILGTIVSHIVARPS